MITERAPEGSPGGGCGQAGGKPPLAGRRVLTQDKGGKLGLKLKVLVLEDAATMRKMRNYLKQRGLENTAPFDEDILPRAIFWLKK